MIESDYLKNYVGPVLAKAIAETVVAQPSNPQEYLALYLLHHLQEEERKANETARKVSTAQLEEAWNAEQAVREKAAAETIARGMNSFRAKIAARKAAEAELQELYDEAVGDADELLDQEEAIREEERENAGGGKADDGEADAEKMGENRKLYETLQSEEEKLPEARAEFYRAQRFILQLQKSHVGQLKNALMEFKERVRIGKAEVEQIADNTAAEEMDEAEKDWRLQTKQDAQQLSEAAAALAAKALGHRAHDHISTHHVLYRVLRCICYLVLDATPKATDSAVKVAALIKPTVLAATLRAFNPVAAYDRATALKLERNMPSHSGEGGDDDAANNDNNNNDMNEGEESYPMPQTKTRQVRRAQRVLRALLSDTEYVCQINPADYFDEDFIDAEANEEEEEEEAAAQDAATGPKKRTVKDEIQEAEAAAARAAAVKETVEEQTKKRGGLVLWALLRYITAAVAFRQCRDSIVSVRKELGLDTTPSGSADASAAVLALLEELPAEEEEDEVNDEVILNEEGEVDHDEVRRLQARIGTDEDEQLVKLWEAKDARKVRELESRAEAFRVAAEAEDEENDEENGDAE